jgi:hypothetical protein
VSCKFLVENLQIFCKFFAKHMNKLLAKHTKALIRWAHKSCSSHDCLALGTHDLLRYEAHSWSGNASTAQEQA